MRTYTGRELDEIVSRHRQAERDRLLAASWASLSAGFLLACLVMAAVRWLG